MTIRLENWSLYRDPYGAPELGTSIHGYVYGHPKFEDGDPVTTSPIASYKDGVFTTRSGSEYILGEVEDEYEAMFPNSYERVIAQAIALNEELKDE